MRFTTLPFLLAFMAGLLRMPALDIYDIHARNVGTVHAEPWRRKASTMAARLASVFARCVDFLWPHRQQVAAIACALLVLLLAPDLHAHGLSVCAVGALGNIKQLIQDEADTKKAIAALKKEGRALSALKGRTPEQAAADETRYAAIFAELDSHEEQLAATVLGLAHARRLQEDERASDDTLPVIQVGKDLAEKKVSLGQFLQGIAYTETGRAGLLSPEVMAAVTGASSGSSTDGGFLVRADWNTSLLDRMKQEGVLAPRCLNIPIGPDADGLEAPYVNETSRATGSRWGGVQVFRAAEAATVAASKPTLGKFELRLDDLMGLFYATDRLLRDTTALEAIAMKAFPSEFAFKLDDEIIRGDGAGQCLGILNAPATIVVAKETGQATRTIVAQNVINMYARLQASKIKNAAWYINQECLPQLQTMYVAIGVGGQLVYMPPTGLADAPYGTLLGRPVVPIEQASGLGTVGDIIFASLNDDYLVIEKPMTSASSEHVRFLFNEKVFKWVYPIIGRPLLQAPITPFKATTATTLSPFVTLAARP